MEDRLAHFPEKAKGQRVQRPNTATDRGSWLESLMNQAVAVSSGAVCREIIGGLIIVLSFGD